MAKDDDFGFFSGEQAINSLRKSGYRNAAMALGELVDNSVEAKSKKVDIMVQEKAVQVGRRIYNTIDKIGILDNGTGMDKNLLRSCLLFGSGTKFGNTKGIGKFGVGLPQASISQCKRVDIWSWQNDPKNAFHTYIDLSDKKWIKDNTIPKPTKIPIPDEWMNCSDIFSKSGTLVVWSKIDKCTWKTYSALFRNSELLIGRMYRNWIKGKKTQIRFVKIDGDSNNVLESSIVKATDPLYLFKDTSVSDVDPPVDPMFEILGNPHPFTFNFTNEDGKKCKETVTLTFSITKKKTRQTSLDAGRLPHGKHAARNIGLSIVREGRELELDDKWATKDPRERWWGAQIEFGRGMDDIFDVTNNKQHAQNLSAMANKNWRDYQESSDETQHQVYERLKDQDYYTYVNLFITDKINNVLGSIRERDVYKKAPKKKSKEDKPADDSPEAKASGATEERKKKGKTGESDKDAELPKNERKVLIQKKLEDLGYGVDDIDRISGDLVDSGLKYAIIQRSIDTSAFFSVESLPGGLLIAINTEHEAYPTLFSTLIDTDLEGLSEEELKEHISKANDALKFILEAWGRLEDESDRKTRSKLKDIRRDWGRMAKDFITYDEGDE